MKSGTGDLHLLQNPSGILDPFRKDLGDFTGILSRLRGKDHGHVGGVIPVAGILCQFHFDMGRRRRGE